jgi:type I restriction enzyme S subunit
LNQEIPENWIKVKFGELAKQKSVRVDDPGESGYEKYVGLEHLDSGELVVKRYGSTSDVTSTMKLFEKDDILFARRNTYLRRVSVAPFDGVCSGDIIVLEPILKHIVKGFLPIFMQFELFENKIIALSAGAFSKRIKWKQLAEEEVIIPSIKEQKKIVETIWGIQDTIEKTNTLIGKTKKLKTGLINELLTKGIGHDKFKKTEFGMLPECWELTTLSELITSNKICSHLDGNHGSKYPKSNEFVDSGIPYVSANCIVDGKVDMQYAKFLTESKAQKFTKGVAKNGDVLLAHNATVGPTAILQSSYPYVILGTSLTYYRCNPSYFDNDFLYFYLQSPLFQNQLQNVMKQSTRNQVPITTQRKLYFVVPPLTEQKKIASIIKNIEDNQISYTDNKLRIESVKKKLTNEILSGKIRIKREV